MHKRIFLLLGILFITSNIFAQDPNFYIYLCFGQSNMEGNPGTIEEQDRTVDSRFQVLEAVSCSNLGRTMGNWYTAVPPLCRCYSGLSPADYFGRTMVENLPDSIKVGVINVSVAGCKIELFDKDNYQTYAATVESWMTGIINEYGGNPYARLVEMAQLAKQGGVIKGILLHQGESNTGDSQWPNKVKLVYDNLLNDLELDPDSIPLLAGEVVHEDQGGQCATMNTIIGRLPQTIPNSYVISSSGCTTSERLHFDSAGYRKLGARYAVKMLSLLGYEVEEPEPPQPPSVEGTTSIYFEPECAEIGSNWDILSDAGASNGSYVMVKPGIQSITSASAGSEDVINFPISIDTAGTYKVLARLNCPTYDDDSYWVKMDNSEFVMCNGLVTSGWQWLELSSYNLTAGEHTLTINYREDGAKLDKICISNYPNLPQGIGGEAVNVCTPTDKETSTEIPEGYFLGQNYPNPFNPSTEIIFKIAEPGFVTVTIYDTLGKLVTQLLAEEKQAGDYSLKFDASDLSSGTYYYQMKVNDFTSTKKMTLIK